MAMVVVTSLMRSRTMTTTTVSANLTTSLAFLEFFVRLFNIVEQIFTELLCLGNHVGVWATVDKMILVAAWLEY
jgi:hypothetical protein